MSEEERKIVEKFERLYLRDFNGEKITNEDKLSYIECALISNLIEKLQKENEELKKSKITYERVRYIQEKNRNVVDNNYISKQKIKDKIEEIKARMGKDCIALHEFQREAKIDVLQELLESEEK